MAYDLSAFQAKLQATIAALPAAPDPKALLLIAKAIEGTTPSVALSDILAASTAQQAILTAQGTTAVAAVNKARDDAIVAIQQAGQGSAAASGVSFSPTGQIGATNVQSAIAELDAEKQPLATALTALGALAPAADRLPYFTGAGAGALTAFTAAARALLDDADAATMLRTLGLTDGAGKLLASLMPALAINDVFPVASQAAMLALTAERGDVAIRTDIAATFILAADDPATLANWKQLPLPAGVVMQVAGLSGPSITGPQIKTALAIALADITDASANGRSLLAMTYAQMATALGVPTITKATAALIRAGADDAGFITAKALADAGVPVQVPYTATVTLDLAAGTDFEIDPLTGNLTLANPAVIPPRWSGTILLPQDATGGRTISYGSAFKIAGGTPTASTAANAVDMLACRANRAGTLIRASFLKGFA